nr:hypothetical protein CFP56_36367 [Quercus suber]
MPKKRKATFKDYASASSQHNSSLSAHHGIDSSSVGSSTQTVNQRLSALRTLPTAEANIKKQQLADQANQRSVPPHLRGILGVTESTPPRPKFGIRFRDRMRTPGPPPPKSWLSSEPAWRPSSISGRRKKGKRPAEAERNRPELMFRFQKLAGEDVDVGAGNGCLSQMTLKRVAQSWEMLDEDDYPALLDVPVRLRLRLLSYLGFYGPTIDIAALQALTQGSDVVGCLDLGGLAGHGLLTLKRVARMIEMDRQQSTNGADDVADSWDLGLSNIEAIALPPSMPRFADLTKLCLSHPPSTILWQDLLNLSNHVPKITHLSLAHWPRPTLTPNLATATVSSQHGPDINAGGSNFYSAIESDREEPAALLRQLSSHTLCLQWLDLEGCADWSPALSLPIEQVTQSRSSTLQSLHTNDVDDYHWSQFARNATTIFGDTWKNVTYINLSQAGPLPTMSGIEAQQTRPSHIALTQQLYSHVRTQQPSRQSPPPPVSRDVYGTEKRFAAMWLERERRLACTASQINALRVQCKMDRVVADFGWRKAAATSV